VKKAYLEEFKQYYKCNVDLQDVVFGCFPNISEINELFEPLIVEEVKRSILEIRTKLQKKSNAVNVAMKINELERAALNQEDEGQDGEEEVELDLVG
jgi:hypothetical protein